MAKVEIYTKDNCPYCTKAKILLDLLGADYEELHIGQHPEKLDELRERLPSARTMPQIFIDDAPVGGCDDLYALHEEGKLGMMLEA